MPSSPFLTISPSESSNLSAIFSPKFVGPEAARISNLWLLKRTANVPSCGRRRSAISISERTLSAEIDDFPSAAQSVVIFCMTPSIRQRTTTSSPLFGSKCKSVAPFLIAFSNNSCTVRIAFELLRSIPVPWPSSGEPSFLRRMTALFSLCEASCCIDLLSKDSIFSTPKRLAILTRIFLRKSAHKIRSRVGAFLSLVKVYKKIPVIKMIAKIGVAASPHI